MRLTVPNDAKLIALMLAARGIQDADERVLHQLLDFAHRYTSDILQDAQAYADHANRPGRVETEDVELAVQARSGWEFTEAAPKDPFSRPFYKQYLLPIARELNKIPLPTLSAAYSHIALPEPHLMLGHPNFTLVPRYPAPESLGLFRTGEEGSDSDEDGDGESEEMDDEDDDDEEEEEEEGSSHRTGDEQTKTISQERNEDGEVSSGDKMDTDAPNNPRTDVPTARTPAGQAEEQADNVRVNGVKRHLEEDDDYDA
ncbi:hypothetical protein QFC22_004849 [Naganishia vaughanmartiniae]|uniref:Uncharacterized protein n=1 Tax=Naganishia vaughanmartiniae TaxID=1424756 RepID=A0ACC2WXN4_9TREE|nr:hypothetical protein QFC22_004849 [Naganishia vaughanmartiniae]